MVVLSSFCTLQNLGCSEDQREPQHNLDSSGHLPKLTAALLWASVLPRIYLVSHPQHAPPATGTPTFPRFARRSLQTGLLLPFIAFYPFTWHKGTGVGVRI